MKIEEIIKGLYSCCFGDGRDYIRKLEFNLNQLEVDKLEAYRAIVELEANYYYNNGEYSNTERLTKAEKYLGERSERD